MRESGPSGRAFAALAGATVLQCVPAMDDDRLGRAILDLSVALLRAGARALVAGRGGPLVGELQALGGEWTEIDFASTRPLAERRATAALRKLVRTERVDVVHAHGVDAAACALGAVRRSDTKLVTTYIGAPPAPSWRAGRQDAPARGDRVLAFSQFAARLIAERYGAPLERITVVPPSVDTALFDPAAVGEARISGLREAWGIAPDERLILAPSRIPAAHGYRTLVEAMRLLVNGGLGGTVVVITAPDLAEEDGGPGIDARIAAQGLAPAFRRVGPCADMPAGMAASDLVVIPTERASTFHVLAAQAQAMARPVVASDIGALPEMLDGGAGNPSAEATGWLVTPGDPFALARAMAAALSLPEADARALGARARRLAEERFAPAQVAKATLYAYQGLLTSRG